MPPFQRMTDLKNSTSRSAAVRVLGKPSRSQLAAWKYALLAPTTATIFPVILYTSRTVRTTASRICHVVASSAV